MKPKVIILRGLPGSGKTSYAARLALEYGCRIRHVSADSYFTQPDGTYHYDPNAASRAHRETLHAYLRLLEHPPEHTDVIIVDNTNTRAVEIAPYYALADIFGLDVEIHQIEADPAVAYARNLHGVPEETFARMREHFEREVLPSWWRVVRIPA